MGDRVESPLLDRLTGLRYRGTSRRNVRITMLLANQLDAGREGARIIGFRHVSDFLM